MSESSSFGVTSSALAMRTSIARLSFVLLVSMWLMFALLVKIYIKQGEIQENQAEILKKLKEIEPKEENKQE